MRRCEPQVRRAMCSELAVRALRRSLFVESLLEYSYVYLNVELPGSSCTLLILGVNVSVCL